MLLPSYMIRKTKDLPPDVTRDLHATSHQRSHKTTILPATDATARPRTEARSAAASVLSHNTAEKRNRFHEYFQYKQRLLAAAGQCEARRGCVPSEGATEDYRFRVTAPCYIPRATCHVSLQVPRRVPRVHGAPGPRQPRHQQHQLEDDDPLQAGERQGRKRVLQVGDLSSCQYGDEDIAIYVDI